METIKKAIRILLIGKKQKFVFKKTKDKIIFPTVKEIDLYIHIPFCKNICPYCPYNKVLYKKHLIENYFKALSREIDIYSHKLGKIKVNSIYIGGGTPTSTIDELGVILNKIKSKFCVVGDIAIETTIVDINETNLQKMKKMGVTMLSIGVQSFNNKYLKFLGRNYTEKDVYSKFEKIKKADFKNINIDLIFAYPKQTKKELLCEIKKAKKIKADQVTLYPLFSFPYSSVGKYLKLKKIKMPKFLTRKKFYTLIYNYFRKNNYIMTSVWSFKRDKNIKKYSSVTRNEYIGLGAGAGSRLENIFYFNTFSIRDYQNYLLNKKRLPIAIDLPISSNLSNFYWFYWRLYETTFLIDEFNQKADWKLKFLLKIFFLIKFCRKNKSNNSIELTRRGSFWIHLIQNHFVLNYINKVWSKMKTKAFPEKIEI